MAQPVVEGPPPDDGPCAEMPLDPERAAQLARGALCRLDGEALQCMPGLTLGADAKGERDLCLSRDGRPVQRPRCLASRARWYRQELWGLLDGVREPGGERVRINAAHSETTRLEVLVQRQPVVRPGPDGCAYARSPRMDFVPPKTKPLGPP